MKRIVSKLCSVLYRTTGHWFPDSYTYIKFGNRNIHIKFGLKYRCFLVKHIITKCGKNVNVERHAKFNKNIYLGDNSGIGSHCSLGPQVYIGDNVMMGPEVIFYTQNHETSRTDIPMCQQGFKEIQPIHIGNDVWIGRRVIILPGVTVGDGCILGAGCVVAKDIPPYSVVVGNPARIVKNRLDK